MLEYDPDNIGILCQRHIHDMDALGVGQINIGQAAVIEAAQMLVGGHYAIVLAAMIGAHSATDRRGRCR